MRRRGPCRLDEVGRCAADLRTDAAAGDIDLLLREDALVEHGGILLFHAHRAAAAAHIAGDFVDVGHMDHGDALFAHAAGRCLQVQLRRHRDDKDEIIPAGPLRHQCLVHAGRVLAHALGHMDAVHGHALLVGVLMRRIGHLGPLQDPHCVGFCFFSHNHVLPITSLPSQSPTATAPPTGGAFQHIRQESSYRLSPLAPMQSGLVQIGSSSLPLSRSPARSEIQSFIRPAQACPTCQGLPLWGSWRAAPERVLFYSTTFPKKYQKAS